MRFALLAILICSPLFAQDIKIKSGETKPVSLRITGEDYSFGVAGNVTWTKQDSDATHLKLTLVGTAPGSATITMVIYRQGRITGIDFITIGITGDAPAPVPPQPVPPIPDPVPPPAPTPTPNPPPIPVPNVASAWLVVIEESSERTAAIAKVMGNLTYWQGLKTQGHNYRFYDKDSAEAKAKGYVARAGTVGLPALLILDPKGGRQPLSATKLPATTAEIDTLLKGVTGK